MEDVALMLKQEKTMRRLLAILLAALLSTAPILSVMAEGEAQNVPQETTTAALASESDPTPEPTAAPTVEPTAEPTSVPTAEPTAEPTSVPTAEPTEVPSEAPTATPAQSATVQPTATPEPTPTATVDGAKDAKAYKLGTPSFSVAILSAFTVKLTWSSVQYAGSYDILMSVNPHDGYSVVGNTTALSFVYTTAALNGQVCYFKMQAKRGSTSSAVDGDISGYRTAYGLAKPVVSNVVAASGNGRVTVSWGAVANANGYRVYRSNSASSGYTLIANLTTTATSTTISGTTTGRLQYYKVLAVRQHTSSATYYGSLSDSAYGFRLEIGAAPVMTSVTSLGASGMQVNFTGTPNADGYYVYRATTGAAQYIATFMPTLSATNTYTFVDPSPVRNRDNTYVLKAFNNYYSSALSNRITAHYVALDRPTLVQAYYLSATSAYLQWTSVSGAAGYHIYKNGTTPAHKIAELVATSYHDTGLTAHEVATYYVCAIKVSVSGGVETTFEGPFVTMPTYLYTPTSLSTDTAAGSTNAVISWTMPNGAGSETDFIVQRSNFPAHGYVKVYDGPATKSGSTYSYTDTTSLAGQGYYYRVQTVRRGATTRVSGHSSVATFISLSQTTPDKIRASGTNGATVYWPSVYGASGYYVYRGEASGSYVYIGYTESNTYTDTGLINGRTYYYRVRPRGYINGTTYLGPLSAERPFVYLAAPVVSIVSPTTTTQVTLSWNAIPGAEYYRVYYGTTPGSYGAPVRENGTTCTVTGLTPGQVYYFAVRAMVDRGGYSPTFDVTIGMMSSEVNGLMINAPTLNDVVPYQTTGIEMTWSAGASSNTYGYAIYRSNYATYGYSYVTDVENVFSYRDDNLNAGFYYYRIRAYRMINGIRYYSAYSTEKGARVLAQPTVLGAYGSVDRTSAVIAWNTVTGATGYTLFRSNASGGVYTPIAQTTSTRFEDGKDGGTSPLTPGATYYYIVRPYQIVNGGMMFGKDSAVKGVTTTAWPSLDTLQTSHPYGANLNTTYTYTITGANYLRLTFDARTATERATDFINVYNAAGTLVGSYSGNQLQSQTITVTGQTATIVFTSGSIGNRHWGFAITNITPLITLSD